MKTDYNKIYKDIIAGLSATPNLLLHSCCAPCSSHVITELSKHFNVTVLYYNPNVEPEEEYLKRKQEQIRFIKEFKTDKKISFIDCLYENETFENMTTGLELEPEGGKRCHKCYELRLRKTAMLAKENDFDFFTTTLTVSPYKNSTIINEIGQKLEDEFQIKYLYSDFKKEDGYKKSIEYSKKYDLYRQNYCGCKHSVKLSL